MTNVHVAILFQATVLLRTTSVRLACREFCNVCARPRNASAQQLRIKHEHRMVGWAGWDTGRWHLCPLI